MKRRIPYEKLREYFKVLEDNVNEDGYALCTVNYAARCVGLPINSGQMAIALLDQMGCVKRYPWQPVPIDGLVKRPQTFTLIKLTGVYPDEQTYDLLP